MTRYLSLAEFGYLAEYVTGIDAATLIKVSRVDLADSAVNAPEAGFGDTDFYPDIYDKAAVLTCRILGLTLLAAVACRIAPIQTGSGVSWSAVGAQKGS